MFIQWENGMSFDLHICESLLIYMWFKDRGQVFLLTIYFYINHVYWIPFFFSSRPQITIWVSLMKKFKAISYFLEKKKRSIENNPGSRRNKFSSSFLILTWNKLPLSHPHTSHPSTYNPLTLSHSHCLQRYTNGTPHTNERKFAGFRNRPQINPTPPFTSFYFPTNLLQFALIHAALRSHQPHFTIWWRTQNFTSTRIRNWISFFSCFQDALINDGLFSKCSNGLCLIVFTATKACSFHFYFFLQKR